MDERCELFMLSKENRERLKDTDMAKRIHSVLYMTDREKDILRA